MDDNKHSFDQNGLDKIAQSAKECMDAINKAGEDCTKKIEAWMKANWESDTAVNFANELKQKYQEIMDNAKTNIANFEKAIEQSLEGYTSIEGQLAKYTPIPKVDLQMLIQAQNGFEDNPTEHGLRKADFTEIKEFMEEFRKTVEQHAMYFADNVKSSGAFLNASLINKASEASDKIINITNSDLGLLNKSADSVLDQEKELNVKTTSANISGLNVNSN